MHFGLFLFGGLFVCFGFCVLCFSVFIWGFLFDFVSVLVLVGFCLVFSLFILVCVFIFSLPLPSPSPFSSVKFGGGGGGIREVQSKEKRGGAFFERSLDFPGVTLLFMYSSGFVTTETASKCQVTKDGRTTY